MYSAIRSTITEKRLNVFKGLYTNNAPWSFYAINFSKSTNQRRILQETSRISAQRLLLLIFNLQISDDFQVRKYHFNWTKYKIYGQKFLCFYVFFQYHDTLYVNNVSILQVYHKKANIYQPFFSQFVNIYWEKRLDSCFLVTNSIIPRRK